MPEDEREIWEPDQYLERLEQIRHIEDPIERHNAAVELLQAAQRDHHLTDEPRYEMIIGRIRRIEREELGPPALRDRH